MYFKVNDTCVCCGACAMDCPVTAIERRGRQFYIHPSRCIECGDCYAICPVGAIEMKRGGAQRIDDEEL